MSRSLSLIALVLLGIVAFGLYRLSYEVQRMEDELLELNRALAQERETIGVLQAEWSYLSRPEYLQDKAERLLDMKPATAKRIVRIEDLPWRQERGGAPVAQQTPALLSSAMPSAAQPSQTTPNSAPASASAPAPAPASLSTPATAQMSAEKAVAPIAVAVPAASTSVANASIASAGPSVPETNDADVAAVLQAMRGGNERRRAQ